MAPKIKFAIVGDVPELGDVVRVSPDDDLERVLDASQANAVYVAVPLPLRREVTVRAVRAGRHVLCEPPMATTEDDCAAMIAASREAGVKLMLAYGLRFAPAYLRAIELIREGRIGDPRLFWAAMAQPAVDGVTFDIGVHLVNAARDLFRDEPVEAFATANVDGVDDTTAAILRFPNGRIAEIEASQHAAGVSALRIVGTEGNLEIEQSFPRDQLGPAMEYFTRCVLEDREPEPSGLEGLADVRICLSLLASAKVNRPVELLPVERTGAHPG
jgi:predicted dehydrogenase